MTSPTATGDSCCRESAPNGDSSEAAFPMAVAEKKKQERDVTEGNSSEMRMAQKILTL